jgi:hypothetical protein
MIECFEQQLEGLLAPPSAFSESESLLIEVVSITEMKVEADPIAAVLVKAGVAEADDPLMSIMKTKVVERQKTFEADYEAWKQSVLRIPAELRAIVESFNTNQTYDRAGYHMRYQTYDLLTIDKYIDILRGKSASKTWFVGLEIFGPTTRDKFLFFFVSASWLLRKDPKISRVSLAVSRHDGTRYNRLSSEPIGLQEIGYRHGELVFVSNDGKMEEGSARNLLQAFLADVIRSYL